MGNKQLTLIVFTTILICGILFMICAWVRFNRLEAKSLELESDVYILKHGLTFQVGYRGESARRLLGKEDMDQQLSSITFGSDDDEDEAPKNKYKSAADGFKTTKTKKKGSNK